MKVTNITTPLEAQAFLARQSQNQQIQSFDHLLKVHTQEVQAKKKAFGDSQLSGDFLQKQASRNPADTQARPQGLAATLPAPLQGSIDKTSVLYQKAQELEAYFVKIMLSSMRNTLSHTSLSGEQSFAGKMYEDMMYDQLSQNMAETAGLGLADRIYLELNPPS